MVTKSIWVSRLMLLGLLLWTSCQPASLSAVEPISADVLNEEYERSSVSVRSKYDGKEIVVHGYAVVAAAMPQAGEDQGSLFLKNNGSKLARSVACWFSKNQVEQFSKIRGGQYVTVRGVFNGEAGVELKFCKLVSIE